MRERNKRMVEVHKTSTLYPNSRPFSAEWWLDMSSFAYLCWQWGELPTHRWSKLDRFIFDRTYRAIERGDFTHL